MILELLPWRTLKTSIRTASTSSVASDSKRKEESSKRKRKRSDSVGSDVLMGNEDGGTTTTEFAAAVMPLHARSQRTSPRRKRVKQDSSGESGLARGPDRDQIRPFISLTAPHQVAVVGYEKEDGGSQGDDEMERWNEHWNFSSRPDPSASFLPNGGGMDAQTDAVKVSPLSALLDGRSGMMYAFQDCNRSLSVWSVDAAISGPDDVLPSDQGGAVERLNFRSGVHALSACLLPPDAVPGGAGGVGGVCSDGVAYVARLLPQKGTKPGWKCKMTYFGSNQLKWGRHDRHLHTFFSRHHQRQSEQDGLTRRKHGDKSVHAANDQTLVMTVVSLNSRNGDVVISNRTMPSSSETDLQLETSIESHVVANIGKRSASDMSTAKGECDRLPESIHVSTLDDARVALAYGTTDSTTEDKNRWTWRFLALDTAMGTPVSSPFSMVASGSSHLWLQDIGPISPFCVAALFCQKKGEADCTYTLNVYDVRRGVELDSIVLSEFSGRVAIGKVKMLTDAHSGTVTLLHSENETLSLSFARFVMPQNNDNVMISYSLANSIETSVAGAANQLGLRSTHLTRRPQPITSLFAIGSENENSGPSAPTANGAVLPLKDYMERGIEKVPEIPLASIIDDAASILMTETPMDQESLNPLQRNLEEKPLGHQKNGFKRLNGTYSSAKLLPKNGGILHEISSEAKAELREAVQSLSLPQPFVDDAISVAATVVLDSDASDNRRKEAVQLISRAAKAGKLSLRAHFDPVTLSAKTRVRNTNDVLQKFLLAARYLSSKSASDAVTPEEIIHTLLKECKETIPESLLVTMLLYLLTFTTKEEMHQFLHSNSSRNTSGVKPVSKSPSKASWKTGMLYFLRAIVSYSPCNAALLRGAISRDLVTVKGRSRNELMLRGLCQLLRESSHDVGMGKRSSLAELLQWISAATDSYLLPRGREDVRASESDSVLSELQTSVDGAIVQSEAILALMSTFDSCVDGLFRTPKATSSVDGDSGNHQLLAADYTIERLAF